MSMCSKGHDRVGVMALFCYPLFCLKIISLFFSRT